MGSHHFAATHELQHPEGRRKTPKGTYNPNDVRPSTTTVAQCESKTRPVSRCHCLTPRSQGSVGTGGVFNLAVVRHNNRIIMVASLQLPHHRHRRGIATSQVKAVWGRFVCHGNPGKHACIHSCRSGAPDVNTACFKGPKTDVERSACSGGAFDVTGVPRGAAREIARVVFVCKMQALSVTGVPRGAARETASVVFVCKMQAISVSGVPPKLVMSTLPTQGGVRCFSGVPSRAARATARWIGVLAHNVQATSVTGVPPPQFGGEQIDEDRGGAMPIV